MGQRGALAPSYSHAAATQYNGETESLIDSHCHFDFEVFDDQRERLLSQCADVDIDGIIIPGIEPVQWQKLERLTAAQSSDCRLWAACGVHPWWLPDAEPCKTDYAQRFDQQMAHSPMIAIGECGLDGSIATPIEHQLLWFEWHLQRARDLQLPLIVHAHRAHNDVIRMLSRYRPTAGGVIHGFSGSVEMALQYWRLGFYIGVGGTITYERATKTRRAVSQLPLESLLLETDAPDMPLQGFQGQSNSPLQLPGVARNLAELRSEPLSEVKQVTSINTRQLFKLG